MCAQCAMLAASAATGARSWLAAGGFRWITPARLKAATIMLIALAVVGGSLRFSGSTPPPKQAHSPVAVSRSGP
jgi:hypothetical protein